MNAVPHYHKLCSRVSHIWGNRRGQHIRSAMDKPRPGKTTFVIMVSPHGPVPTVSASLGNFLGVKMLKLTPELLYQKLWEWGPPTCALTAPLSDPAACWSLRFTYLDNTDSEEGIFTIVLQVELHTTYLLLRSVAKGTLFPRQWVPCTISITEWLSYMC